MSILEVSHRGKDYEAIHYDAQARLLRVLGLSADEYTALFLGGGVRGAGDEEDRQQKRSVPICD